MKMSNLSIGVKLTAGFLNLAVWFVVFGVLYIMRFNSVSTNAHAYAAQTAIADEIRARAMEFLDSHAAVEDSIVGRNADGLKTALAELNAGMDAAVKFLDASDSVLGREEQRSAASALASVL
jgi:hypothetical protein